MGVPTAGQELAPRDRALLRAALRRWIEATADGNEPMRLSVGIGSELSRAFERWLNHRWSLDHLGQRYVTEADTAHAIIARLRAVQAVALRIQQGHGEREVACMLRCNRATVQRDVRAVLDWLVDQIALVEVLQSAERVMP